MPSVQLDQTSRIKIKRPEKYKVVMYNDDFTPMDVVVDILIHIFKKSNNDAVKLMLTVHESDKAVVGVYSYDIAQTKAQKSVKIARELGYPLRVEVEE